MTNIVEKHYSIDAGEGEKLDGCPYSLFEDGHDVQDYIIPPQGYVFSKFIFEPLPDDQIYDGKLTALYEKESLKERMMPALIVMTKIIIICAIIGVIIMLTISVFKPKKPQYYNTNPTPEIIVIDTDTLAAENNAMEPKDTAVFVEQITENQKVIKEKKPIVETQKPVVKDDNQAFRQAFWAMIHQRKLAMNDYDQLYKQYKGKVAGEEYDYLRFTILRDSQSYMKWSRKFRSISSSEIAVIETVDALKSKLNEIN